MAVCTETSKRLMPMHQANVKATPIAEIIHAFTELSNAVGAFHDTIPSETCVLLS